MRNKLGFTISAIISVILLTAAPVIAQTPSTISYQGRLTNAAGQPITTETSVVFTIYTLPSGGSTLDTWTINVTPDANGIFTVELGPVSVGTFDGNKRYLGIKAGADAEMFPRQLLTSAPYAFNTNNIADNAITTGKIAAGGVANSDLASDAVTTDKIAAGAIGNTDLATNAVDAAKVADGSLTKADIADETGFSQEDGDIGSTYDLTGTGQSFASVTITAPAAGYALVIGSAVGWVVHTNGQWDNNIFTVSTTNGDISSSNYGMQIIRIPSAYPTSTTAVCIPVVIQRVFAVSAGSTTFYLNAYDSNNTGDDKIYRARISAIFIPSLYGSSGIAGDHGENSEEAEMLTTQNQQVR